MTTSGTFMVKTELGSAGTIVAGLSAQLFEQLQALKGRAQTLAGQWTGNGASESYQDLQAQWDTASRNLFGDGTKNEDSILGTVAIDLDVIAANWAETEQTNQKTWAH